MESQGSLNSQVSGRQGTKAGVPGPCFSICPSSPFSILCVSVNCIGGLYGLHRWPPTPLTFGWLWPMVYPGRSLEKERRVRSGCFFPLGNALGRASLLASSHRLSDSGLLSVTLSFDVLRTLLSFHPFGLPVATALFLPPPGSCTPTCGFPTP